MELFEQLRVLQQAQGDPAKLALAAVELAYPTASAAERDALKQTLAAAAIPHWCDEAILAALLDFSPADSAARFAQLDRLNEVENFEARGTRAVNVHEAARLALRKRMAREEPQRFRALSARAATYFAADRTSTGRIEWIYHRLCADPDAGAAECEALQREWRQSSPAEDRDALALALRELLSAGLVEGPARMEALLCFGENQYEHSEVTRVADCAQKALDLAKQIGHPTGEARAYDLLGQTLQSQGHLPEALEAQKAALRIRSDLEAKNRLDSIAQWDLAVTHSRLGDIYEAQAEYDQALIAILECFRLCQNLADRYPDNARWRREAAVTQVRAGDILKAQGLKEDALQLFVAGREIIRTLVDADPDNDDWQRDLAMSHYRVGLLYDADHVAEARRSLGEYLRICGELLSQHPDDARRQRDLAVGTSALGFLEAMQSQPAAAEEAFDEGRRILRQLVARDPGNAEWREDLAVACGNLGLVLRQQNELAAAHEAYEESVIHLRDLATRDPANLQRQRDLASGLVELATSHEVLGRPAAAIPHLEEATRMYAALVGAAPDNLGWAAEQKRVDEQLARLRTGSKGTSGAS